MKVLFVSGTRRTGRPYVDPATRLRSFNLANELTRRGHRALMVSQKIFEENFGRFQSYDVFCFHRPSFSETLARNILKLKKNHLLIADYDDLLFDTESALLTSGARQNLFESSNVYTAISAIAAAAILFDNFTLATYPLKERLDQIRKSVRSIVIHNAYPAFMRGIYKSYRLSHPWEKRKFIFGYFPGTMTHTKDYALIADKILRRLESVDSNIVWQGPLQEVEKCMIAHKNIVRLPIVPHIKLTATMAQCKYVLAPLEFTQFNNCKSALKFLEGALCGCITIATPIADMDRFESPLLQKCMSPENWDECIAAANGDACNGNQIETYLKDIYPQLCIEHQADEFEKQFLK